MEHSRYTLFPFFHDRFVFWFPFFFWSAIRRENNTRVLNPCSTFLLSFFKTAWQRQESPLPLAIFPFLDFAL